MKKIFLYSTLMFFLFPPVLHATDYLGVGFHVGFHNNVGNLEEYNPNFEVEPQNNIFIGCAFKANYRFLFLRTGVDTTFLLRKGKVLENSDANDPIEKYRIQYTSIPGFIGLNFPVQDIGSLYIGGGVAYFLGTGSITTSSGSENINASALGYGLVTGVDLKLFPAIRLYLEWEYINARSNPIIQSNTTPDWENLYIDYSGHRILIGVMYYLI